MAEEVEKVASHKLDGLNVLETVGDDRQRIAVREVLHGIQGVGHEVATPWTRKQVFFSKRGCKPCIGNAESAQNSFEPLLSNDIAGDHATVELIPQLVVDLLKNTNESIRIMHALF